MRWREVAKDERKAERISKLSALDNRRILRRRAVFLHSIHAADPQNRRRSLSRHTPPKRIHGNKRYTTVSGRIVGEWLMINFLRLPLIFWKLFIAALIIYIMYFLCRLSDFLGEKADARQRYIFACSVPLAVFLPQPVGVLVCGFVHIPRSVHCLAYHGDSAHIRGVRRARESHGICRRRDCFCRRGISGAVLRRGARAASDSADFFGISMQTRIPSIHPAPAERSFRRRVGSLSRTSRARSDRGGVGF